MKGFLFLSLVFISLSFAEVLYVASASSLKPLVEEAIKVFTAKHPHVEVKVSYGSSGSLYKQIKGGAPYDIFLSASGIYIEKLKEAGKIKKAKIFALGRVVLFSLKPLSKDIEKALLSAKRVAIANPKYAPYGKCALEFLKKIELYERLKTKIVRGPSVAYAFQFVASGGADVGIVSLSLVLSYRKGHYVLLPDNACTPPDHWIALIKGNKRSAETFYELITSKDFKSSIEKLGFLAVP